MNELERTALRRIGDLPSSRWAQGVQAVFQARAVLRPLRLGIMRLQSYQTCILIGFTLLACGGSLPRPEMTEHPRDSFSAVPYPPPAALAETLVARPEDREVVWIDGGWVFRGRSYAWQRGGWVVPPDGARFALSKVVFTRDGRILYAPAGWYDSKGAAVERVRPVAPASTPPNEFTAETQTPR